MIPNKSDIVVSGNMNGARVQMGFAKGAERHLMNLLTDMYSDTELAIIREYSTNALDSHRAADNSRPIEVTLPSPLSPYLKIKDYGVGLSVDDIHNIYSQYGASTKREDADANGMLGIGCKSALTYSSQFTLVAVKAGIRTTVAVSRNADSSASMTIVDTSSTSSPNGVEVSIPAKTGNSIERKAREFFANWHPGTVLINGQPPEHTTGIKITDSILLVQQASSHSIESHIVMAGVTYPAGDKLTSGALNLLRGYSLVATVATGAVDFAPSREALTFSKVTNEVLDQIAKDFKANLIPAVQRELDLQPTRRAAVEFVNKWSRVLGARKPDKLTWRGADIPTSVVRPSSASPYAPRPRMLITTASDYKLSSASDVPSVDLSYLDRAVWVTGYDMVRFTATHKKKLLLWLESRRGEALRVSNFLLVDFPLDTTWIDPARVIKWEDVNALTLPKSPRLASGRVAGSYDLLVKTPGSCAVFRGGVAGSDIDQTNPVFYCQATRDAARSKFVTIFNALLPAYTIVVLPANRVAKFVRENPTLLSAEQQLAKLFSAWASGLTQQQKVALYVATNETETMRALKALSKYDHYIDDPAVVEACKLADVDTKRLDVENRKFGHYNPWIEKLGVTWVDPFDGYPLFPDSLTFTRNAEHVIQYMNDAYWRLQEQAP